METVNVNVDHTGHAIIGVAEPSDVQDAATKNYVDTTIDDAISGITPGVQGSRLISGGGVAWTGTGLDFVVSAATYLINGVVYNSPQTDITLDAADATDDRIDVFAVDSNETAVAITGTPGGPPVAPQVDPATQLELTHVLVPALATEPDVTTEDLYLENTEWTSSQSGGTITLASTNNPFAGTKDIEGTSTVAGNSFTLVKPSGTLAPNDYVSLIFQIRSKAQWPRQKAISIVFLNGTTVVGSAATLINGVYGFVSTNTASYQQVVIPASSFNTGASVIDRIRFSVTGGGGSIGWYIDNIVLQGGFIVGGGGTGGDFSTNTNAAVVGEAVVFADTTGKLGKRSTGTGVAKLTSGVLGTATEGTDYLGPSRIDDTAYDATTWNGDVTHAPTKNAVRDVIESITLGGGDAPGDAHYLTNQSEPGLSAEVNLGALTTGLLKHTVTTGVSTPATAVEGTDYLGSARIDDTAYDATSWNGDATHAPSKNAVRDKFESLSNPVDDTAYDATSWNGDTTHAPSKNAVRDKFESLSIPTDISGLHYVTTQAEAGLSNESNLGALTSGLLKHTVSGSVSTPATATEGTDYLGAARIDDTAYDATSWNGDTTHAPSKNAVRDKIEALSGSNSFSTIAISGQSDVVADSSADTLTIAAGANVTLTTNAGTDTITIAAADGIAGGTISQVSGSDFATTSTTYVDVTGLTYAAGANHVYEVDAMILCQGTNNSGVGVSIAFSAAGASGKWIATGNTSATVAASTGAGLGAAGSSLFNTVTNTYGTIFVKAIVVTGANAGNITLQTAKGSSGTATIYIGSRMNVTQLA